MSDLKTAAREAWIYALPLIEIATMRQRAMGFGQRMGAFTHVRNLATPKHRAVTTPNNDTLYTSAHIDLSQGPVTLTLPPMGERYVSLALMDAYTNNFAILGTRTTGPDGGTFRLVGPMKGPKVSASSAAPPTTSGRWPASWSTAPTTSTPRARRRVGFRCRDRPMTRPARMPSARRPGPTTSPPPPP